ncbi:hypothetical protein DY000_02005964 [Brassica cretica]|uniref:Uncharacterized protein n=1 Tax=Brassica cretica TaxID=69181 RepID=A0ABQ7C0N0_BRACR|nr:hypothetical protein DY000_02005964 [Brassica cretica]
MAATKISGFDMQVFSDLEDFWDDLPVFNLMVLIFHSIKDLENFWDDLPVSRLKYNALDDFQEVFQTTSRKSSRRLPGSLLLPYQVESKLVFVEE